MSSTPITPLDYCYLAHFLISFFSTQNTASFSLALALVLALGEMAEWSKAASC